MESNGNRMMSIARQELFFGRLHGIDETIEAVGAVTPARVREVAGRIFGKGRTAWAAVGPEKSLKKLSPRGV
jgi:predicted Zn-dependent peptidase